MARRAEPPKKNAEAKRPPGHKSPKGDGAKVRDLEKRLAETLKHEAEAREQQAAAGEILGLIASSPDDAQRVFDAIAVNALRLCDAKGAVVVRYDGALLHVAAHHNVNPEAVERLKREYPRTPDHHQPIGRAILDGVVVHVPDFEAAVEFAGSVLRQQGARSHVSIPLLQRGQAIGAIGISRPTLGPFSDAQITLLQTFADQAVIAIETVRLFKELKARNRDLTEALEQQTATGEVLRAISAFPSDLQPVLDEVVKSGARFCGADDASILRVVGGDLRVEAHWGPVGGVIGLLVPVVRGTVGGRSVLERRPIHVTDLQAEGDEFPEGSAIARRIGHRTIVSIPLLREGTAIGTIMLRRNEAKPFTDKQIAQLQTFADQAAIAIENVRLFRGLEASNREIGEKSRQIEAASQHKSEFLANMSHELRTPLNAIIGFSEVLSERMFGDINEKQTEYLQDILESGRHLLSLINDILDLVEDRGGAHGAGVGAVRPAHRHRQRPDPGARAGEPARDQAREHDRRAARDDRRRRAKGEAGPPEPPFQCPEVHPEGAD